jgi:hypothetical protein
MLMFPISSIADSSAASHSSASAEEEEEDVGSEDNTAEDCCCRSESEAQRIGPMLCERARRCRQGVTYAYTCRTLEGTTSTDGPETPPLSSNAHRHVA